MTHTNLPLQYIYHDRAYLDFFLANGLRPELGIDAWVLDNIPPQWHAHTARCFHDAKLSCAIHLPFFDLHPGSLDPLVRTICIERLVQAARVARIYEPMHAIAHLDFNELVSGRHQNEWLDNSIETWTTLLQHMETPLFLENVHEDSPAYQANVLTHVSGNIGACLDIGHWHCFGKGWQRHDLSTWLDTLSAFPLHLHLHDNDGNSDQHFGLGRGSIPWQELWDWTRKKNTHPSVTMEPHTKTDFYATLSYLRHHPELFFLQTGDTPGGLEESRI